MRRTCLLLAALIAAACGRSPLPAATPGGSTTSTAQLPTSTSTSSSSHGAGPAWSPEEGFVVHEWGTLTYVVGSDGSLVPGLHHEEEDLPPFVADRMAQARLTGTVLTKMETPVTYFYAPAAMKVSAKVSFPRGLLTQWYPYAAKMLPAVYQGSAVNDPWVNVLNCSADYPFAALSAADSYLDWGTFDILSPGDAAALAGPLGDTTWHFARNTASNVLAVPMPDGSGLQHEKFLFYRGLGNVELPLKTQLDPDGLTLRNAQAAPLGALFLMEVGANGASFQALGALAGGAALRVSTHAPAKPLSAFVPALKDALRDALVADGLYADEAQAMVDTWERSYFLTPGVRLLYLLPQASTDAFLPLQLRPAPSALRRTMVIRLELLTPEQEQAHAGWVAQLAADPATAVVAQTRFRTLGRFAEPSLRRALALVGDGVGAKEGQALLTAIQATRRWQPSTVE